MLGYTFSHIFLGLLSNHFSYITPLFYAYQTFQLATNSRFFIHKMNWKSGNSVIHTAKKIGEFSVGKYFI